MEKPILATNIDGFLIKHEAFILPHLLWFDRVIALLKDKSLEQWKGAKDYFKGVDIAMKKLMPKATEQERTKQARDWYQEDTITYIRFHPEVVNQKLVKLLKKLKTKFTLALITTNTREHIHQILEAGNLQGIYDIIFATSVSEKPEKAKLFEDFEKIHGTPKFYIAGRSKEGFEECLKLGSICVYLSLEETDPEIEKIANKTIFSILSLEKYLASERID